MSTFPNDDILAGVPRKLFWQECVHDSVERPAFKYLLMLIGRYFKRDARGSSVSYAQIARECRCDVRTAKRHIKLAEKNGWLVVGRRLGFKHPKGRANIYDGAVPVQRLQSTVEQIVKRLRGDKSDGDIPPPLQMSPVLEPNSAYQRREVTPSYYSSNGTLATGADATPDPPHSRPNGGRDLLNGGDAS